MKSEYNMKWLVKSKGQFKDKMDLFLVKRLLKKTMYFIQSRIQEESTAFADHFEGSKATYYRTLDFDIILLAHKV